MEKIYLSYFTESNNEKFLQIQDSQKTITWKIPGKLNKEKNKFFKL